MKNRIQLTVKVLACVALAALFTFNTITFMDNSGQFELSLASLNTAFAQSETGGSKVESIVNAIINYTKTEVGPDGGTCVETGSISTVSCVGVGTLNYSPSTRQVSGPWY
jgi:hypothetical protein